MNSFDQVKQGEFKRTATDFHNRLGTETFPVEPNRYTLYASLACPWAHRCLLVRALKGLHKAIDVSIVHPVWGEVDPATGKKSWVFGSEDVGGFPTQDKHYQKKSMREIYEIHDPDYQGRYTVPVLFDTKTKTIVNNESSEIIQILDQDMQSLAERPDFSVRPSDVDVAEIEKWNDKMYNSFNNGVYRAGFAQAQEAHIAGQNDVFGYLDEVDIELKSRKFLCGDKLTEADIRMWVTAVRFDPVYNIHFKCSRNRLSDYEHVSRWMRDVWEEMKNIVGAENKGLLHLSEEHIKQHYYRSHPLLNPFGLVPVTRPLGFD